MYEYNTMYCKSCASAKSRRDVSVGERRSAATAQHPSLMPLPLAAHHDLFHPAEALLFLLRNLHLLLLLFTSILRKTKVTLCTRLQKNALLPIPYQCLPHSTQSSERPLNTRSPHFRPYLPNSTARGSLQNPEDETRIARKVDQIAVKRTNGHL